MNLNFYSNRSSRTFKKSCQSQVSRRTNFFQAPFEFIMTKKTKMIVKSNFRPKQIELGSLETDRRDKKWFRFAGKKNSGARVSEEIVVGKFFGSNEDEFWQVARMTLLSLQNFFAKGWILAFVEIWAKWIVLSPTRSRFFELIFLAVFCIRLKVFGHGLNYCIFIIINLLMYENCEYY